MAGFYSVDLGAYYTPTPELVQFLKVGGPTIYIGLANFLSYYLEQRLSSLCRFGSVVVEDSAALTSNPLTIFPMSLPLIHTDLLELMFDATAKAGVRAFVSVDWVSLFHLGWQALVMTIYI